MTPILSCSVFTLISIALGIVWRIFLIKKFFPDYPDRDEISHLILVDNIRQNQGKIASDLDSFLLYKNSYPNGFHKLVALSGITREQLEKWGRYFPCIFDSLLIILSSLFILVAGNSHFEWVLLIPLLRNFWNKKPSIFFGERAFGVLFGAGFLVFSYLYAQSGQWIWAFAGVLSFLIASISSVFANQAMCFISVLVSLILMDYHYVLNYLTALLSAIVLSKGYVITVLSSQIRYSYLYATYLSKRYLPFNHYLNFIKVFHKFRFSNFTKQFFDNPVWMTVSNMPTNIAFVYLWGLAGWPITPLDAFVLSGIILCLVIATEPLKFIGQAERYMEFTIPFLFCTLSRYSALDYGWLFLMVLGFQLLAIRHHLQANKKWETTCFKKEYEHYNELLQFLTPLNNTTILPVPTKICHYLTYQLKKHRYVSYFINPDTHENFKWFTPDQYAYPGSDLSSYINKFEVSYIIVHKKSADFMTKHMKRDTPYYNFTDYTAVLENETFVIYQTNIRDSA